MIDLAYDLDRLAWTDDEVARLTACQRQERVEELIEESNTLLDLAIQRFITDDGKTLAGIVGLFSGGNDSTVLCHLFRERITHLAHANTTIGIEDTRRYVRSTAAAWGLTLLEFTPDAGDTYRDLVLDRGFPGPGQHYKMFQRLKERCLRKVRRLLVGKRGRRERVIFLAGRRRTESNRRANVPAFERDGSVVWVSPLVNWTKLDMNTYRLLVGDVPRNQASDLLHMSGECLCGAFAKKGELDEIAMFYPDVVAEIRALEAEIADREDIPAYRRKWGWGGDPDVLKRSRKPKAKSGRLCSSCDARYLAEPLFGDSSPEPAHNHEAVA